MKNKKYEQPQYSGLLAKPMPIWPLIFDPDKPEFFYKTLLVQVLDQKPEVVHDFWRRHVVEGRAAYAQDRQRRFDLLLEHYGIESSDPHAKDKLLEALMAAHVPAFNIALARENHSKRRADKPTKLDVLGTVALYYRNFLKQQEKRTDEDALTIKKITNSLLRSGLSQRTIDDYSQQIGKAASAYYEGKASDFQRQFIEEVLPFLESKATEWRASMRDSPPDRELDKIMGQHFVLTSKC